MLHARQSTRHSLSSLSSTTGCVMRSIMQTWPYHPGTEIRRMPEFIIPAAISTVVAVVIAIAVWWREERGRRDAYKRKARR